MREKLKAGDDVREPFAGVHAVRVAGQGAASNTGQLVGVAPALLVYLRGNVQRPSKGHGTAVIVGLHHVSISR